jgi:hypothetical protein
MGYGDIDLQEACLGPPCGVFLRHVDYPEQIVCNYPALRSLSEVAEDRELQDPTNHTPPFTSDRSRSSAAIDIGCEAIQVESMNAADHGGFKCHAGLAVSIRLFTIWKLFTLFNASP